MITQRYSEMMGSWFVGTFVGFFVVLGCSVEGRILKQCEAAQELCKAKVPRTFISNWVCLMMSESGLNTSLVKGPGKLSSFTYGVFQISSLNGKYCIRGRRGGMCNKRCEDFTDDDIRDDIACAMKIAACEGFNHWKGWIDKYSHPTTVYRH